MKMKSNNTITSYILSVGLFIVSVILTTSSMTSSGFYDAFKSELTTVALILVLFITIIYRIFKTPASAYLATLTSILLYGNFSQIMLYYTCNQPTDAVRKDIITFTALTIGSIIFSFILLFILNKFKQNKLLNIIFFALVAMLSVALVLIFTNGNNTSTIGEGFQPAIIMMFIILYAFAGATTGKIQYRIPYLVFFFVIIGSLVIRHEFGVPLFCFTACFMTFIFSNKFKPFSKKELWFTISLIIIPIAGLIIILGIRNDLRIDTFSKFITRFDPENYHSQTAMFNLQTSGLLGSPSYDVYLPEASSDYALNSSVHYFGILWLATFLFTFSIMCIKTRSIFSKQPNVNIISNLRELSFAAIIVILSYNILSNLAGFPIIGMQSLCLGSSKSIAILSGFLIGSVLFDPIALKSAVESLLVRFDFIKEVTPNNN